MEIKSVQTGKIEYLLKLILWCNLNIEANKYENDVDCSKKCNYEKCDYTCNPNLKEHLKKTEIDYDTITPLVLQDQINDVIKVIKFGSYKQKPIFKEKYYYNLNDILKKISMEKIVVFLALHKIITEHITLFVEIIINLIFSNW